jgi:predicted RNA-binding protein YlxR (DUF448 family)
MKEKKELIRVVRTPEGEIALDFRGKVPGRGAYVCRSPECLEKAVRTRALERALGGKIPEELYDGLREQMEAGE